VNAATRTGAAHRRHASKQDYETPWELVRAVERRWGPITVDLAADATNAKAPLWIDEATDSFTIEWHKLGGLLWLNPPFANIAPWASKCACEMGLGARIAFLVPAAVGSRWFIDSVYPRALVCPLCPRVSFDGKNPYPKDVMLCLFDSDVIPTLRPWLWREGA